MSCEVFGPMVVYFQVFILIGLAGVLYELKKRRDPPHPGITRVSAETEREAAREKQIPYLGKWLGPE